jgi:hypothetical protein
MISPAVFFSMRAIKPMFPNKPRAVPRVNDRRASSGPFAFALDHGFQPRGRALAPVAMPAPYEL